MHVGQGGHRAETFHDYVRTIARPAGCSNPGNPNSREAATSTSSPIPADAARQAETPVKPTPESIASGKKYYGYDCAMCHGANGDGKGDVAIDEKLKIGDFRDPATLKDKTDV